MRFWMRELAGWLIVGVGLLLIYFTYDMLQNNYPPRIIEAWPLAISGIFVFRGGIHLLKVAVAARICLQAQERLYPTALSSNDPKGSARVRSPAGRR